MEGKISPRRRRAWVALGLVALLLLFLVMGCCSTPEEEDTDQVKRLAAGVWAGAGANPPQLVDNDWHALSTGDAVRTDGSGEAELNLADCTGSVWVFKNSQFGAYSCRKGPQASGNCQGGGDVGVECKGRFTIDTPSCTITIQGTAFAVSYLPEKLLTVVTALDGEVLVTPVEDVGTGKLAGQPVAVHAGQWLYTLPGPKPEPLAGLDPRTALPMEKLPLLAEKLELQTRFEEITLWGQEQKILPRIWPFKAGIGLWYGGGPLEQAGIGDEVLQAIDFKRMFADETIDADVPFDVALRDGRMIEAMALEYDPETVKARLAEAFPQGLDAYVVHPAGDGLLAAVAERIAGRLASVGLKAKVMPVGVSNLEGFVRRTREGGTLVFWLQRR